MLLSFSIENFRSFKEESVVDFTASALKPAYSWLEDNTTKLLEKDEVVKVKAIYGANASGKSTLLVAIAVWQGIALMTDKGTKHFYDANSFALDVNCYNHPTRLEGIFTHNGKKFEYGVEFTNSGISKEWLYDRTIRKARIFSRTGDKVTTNSTHFPKDDRLEFLLGESNDIFGPKVSFLAAGALLKLTPVLETVTTSLRGLTVLGDYTEERQAPTAARMLAGNPDLRRETSEMLKLMGIEHERLLAFDKEKMDVSTPLFITELVDQSKERFVTATSHRVKGADGQELVTLTNIFESAGTKKVLQLIPFVINTLRIGGVLIVDEFEAQLHTRLSREIVQLFNSRSGNPNNAQFIFSTHDTNLLDNKLLRRDQIALVEKDEDGASTVFALSDITGVENTANFEREYLGGSYGAVPSVRDLDLALDLDYTSHE